MTISHSALITGASQGLGLHIARAYARRGLSLILTARGPRALDETARELSRTTEVLAVPGDVADLAHVERLVQGGLERFGRIDVLINNASELGPSPMPELAALAPVTFERILQVNVVAPLR